MRMRERMERMAGLLELLGAAASALVMFGCFAFGFVDVVKALFAGKEAAATSSILINATLAGLEMFFLAPLPFLAFFGMARLFRAVIRGNPTNLRSAQNLVVDVKRLITGLMIATVSTELIHRITSGTELTPMSVVSALGLVAVLSMYYWALGDKHATVQPMHESVSGSVVTLGMSTDSTGEGGITNGMC